MFQRSLVSTVKSLHMGLFLLHKSLFQLVVQVVLCTVKEVFYGTQYDLYDRLKKDSYVIKNRLICKDSTVEINSERPVFLIVVR
jgi:hypothetical protein